MKRKANHEQHDEALAQLLREMLIISPDSGNHQGGEKEGGFLMFSFTLQLKIYVTVFKSTHNSYVNNST
jgi:hypothetical protein